MARLSTLFSAGAALALVGSSNAHMIMKTPAPYGDPDNSPLDSTGSNYPCKLSGDPSTFYSGVEATKLTAGVNATLSFTGSTVHGGGSCQLAITTDPQPSVSTAWSVILSIEGGCPSTDGVNPSTYAYSIPDYVPDGDYVFAWTWISKESGSPEYYMNCGPISVSGSTSKRSIYERDETAADLVNLFVANLDSVNSCVSRTGGASIDVLYPYPGPIVEQPGSDNDFSKAVGTDCFPTGTTKEGILAGDSSSTSSNSSSSESSGTDSSSSAAASTPTTAAGGGGPMVSASASSPAVASASASSSASSSGGLSGTCTSEGTFNCVGGSKYQQCASGSWTALQSMPAGTTCTEGESTTLWSREVRNLRRGNRATVAAAI